MSTPSIPGAVRRMVEMFLRNVRGALPGVIEDYDAATQTASVKPLLMEGYFDEAGERKVDSLPVIPDVPVVFQGAGDFSITFPLSRGDTVLLIFAGGSLDKWLQYGGEVDPLDDRRFDLSDAIAIPGLRAKPDASGNVDGSAMVFGASLLKLGSKDANDPVVRKSDLDIFRTTYNNHTHNDPASGVTGVTNQLQSSIACSQKVKVD